RSVTGFAPRGGQLRRCCAETCGRLAYCSHMALDSPVSPMAGVSDPRAVLRQNLFPGVDLFAPVNVGAASQNSLRNVRISGRRAAPINLEARLLGRLRAPHDGA